MDTFKYAYMLKQIMAEINDKLRNAIKDTPKLKVILNYGAVCIPY